VAVKLFYEVELELNGHPRSKLVRYFFVSVISAVALGIGSDTDGPSRFDPLLRRHNKGVQAGLGSKRLEFDTVKNWVVEKLPHFDALLDDFKE